jgi:cation:H+ antiporter
LRLGSPDLAIANLLGSNLFDILVLAVDDLAFSEGPLLSFVSPTHAATAFSAVMMTGVVIAGLLYRPAKRLVGLVGWISIALLLIYLFSAYLVFLYGH